MLNSFFSLFKVRFEVFKYKSKFNSAKQKVMTKHISANYLISSGNPGIVLQQFFDNVCITSPSSPRQARHVMLRCHGNSSSSNNNINDVPGIYTKL